MADQRSSSELAININTDTTPVLYTDNIFMSTNEDGVVFNFGQMVGSTNQLRIVSRIGMSRVHAKKFLKEFGKLLALTDGNVQTGDKKDN